MSRNKTNKNQNSVIPKIVKEQNSPAWINKKGKITGKNKTEKKVKDGGCIHHGIKNGKMVPMLTPINDKEFYCDKCKRIVPLAMFTEEEVKDICREHDKVVANAQFYAVALNMGDDAITYFSNVGKMNAVFPKNYKKVNKTVSKNNEIARKKRGNKKEHRRNNSYLGEWGV